MIARVIMEKTTGENYINKDNSRFIVISRIMVRRDLVGEKVQHAGKQLGKDTKDEHEIEIMRIRMRAELQTSVQATTRAFSSPMDILVIPHFV